MSSATSNAMTTTTKNFRNKKKIDEVKEIIQNRPDVEISRVLEYFDNDVGKAIDAFVTDGGKEALAKWNEAKNEKKKAKKNNDNAVEQGATGEEADAKNGAKGGKGKKANKSNKQSQQNGAASGRGSANRNNINDLVASIINQYTGPNAPSSAAPAVAAATPANGLASLSVDPNEAGNKQGQQLVEDLNRLVLSANNTATISGLKVTVMGIQTNQSNITHAANVNSTPQTISSVSSSPSSMSSSSSFDTRQLLQSNTNNNSASVTSNGGRPSLLELSKANNTTSAVNNNGKAAPAAGPRRTFNKQINNPKARELLEKPQKDLQRQSAVLSKIATVFQEEANKGQLLLVQTFSQLHKLLDQRQAQLQSQLLAAVKSGNEILQQRQAKAADLKLCVDNSVHLSDDETLELKADIKHFVSERQLDEEFGKLKLFDDACKELIESIQRAGSVPLITNRYAKQRPPLSELLNGNATPVTPAPAPPVNGKSVKNGGGAHVVEQLDTNNNRNPVASNGHSLKNGINGGGAGGDDQEGEFIEVKKTRKNKPKPAQQQQQAPPVAEAAPAPVGKTNGFHNGSSNKAYTNGQVNGATKPSSSLAKPQRNGEVRAH